jgi:hypothetical protein
VYDIKGKNSGELEDGSDESFALTLLLRSLPSCVRSVELEGGWRLTRVV